MQPRRRPTSLVQVQTAGATCWRRPGWRPTPASSAKNPRSWPPTPAGTCSGRGTCRRSRTSWTRPTSFRVLPADFVSTEDGTGIVHMSPAYGEDDMATTTGGGHRRGHTGRLQGPLRRDGARTTPGQHVFDANPQIIRDLKNQGRSGGRQRRGAAASRDLRALLPALLALPKPVDLPGGVVVVRQGHRVPRPDGRTQPGDHLVSRTRQGRPVRQVAAKARGTGRSPETATGAARFRCGSPTTRRIRASTSTAASTNSSATSGCVRRICTGPTSTS